MSQAARNLLPGGRVHEALRARALLREVPSRSRGRATRGDDQLDVHLLGRDLLHSPDARAVEAQLQRARRASRARSFVSTAS
jgi:hypothetical protein